MKRVSFIVCLCSLALYSIAQQYPTEWEKYTDKKYMYDIQSDINTLDKSETDFKNYLLNIARTNLAKQIHVKVEDYAALKKQAINGTTSITYSSLTSFSTNVDMKLVETKTTYDASSKTGHAIAYINREVAQDFYRNELSIILNKINNSILLAESYIGAGFKSKAQAELNLSLNLFAPIDNNILWLNLFGTSQSEISQWQNSFSTTEQKIKQKLADLEYGTVIYLSCKADLFGTTYTKLQNELKGILATDGCSFTNNPAEADWAITIYCYATEYTSNNFGNTTTYFAYVNAQIVIDKVITSQRIYEDEITIKGGHTTGFTQAAKDGYKKIKKQLGEAISRNIKQ
ncbi:MAG: hypothetical protein IJ442_02905 [Bacteroidaceae bacterium]|nr:hypothetical protein [Bacteroidaceae bacterium]